MRTRTPSCFSSNPKLNSSCCHEQQQQRQRLERIEDWRRSGRSDRRVRYPSRSKILLPIGLPYGDLKFWDHHHANSEHGHESPNLNLHVRLNWTSLQRRWLFSIKCNASGGLACRPNSWNSRFQTLTSAAEFCDSVTPNVRHRLSGLTTTSSLQKLHPVAELDSRDPCINSNNNSRGTRGKKRRRKRSRQTVLLSGLHNSEQPRKADNHHIAVSPWLAFWRILGLGSPPSRSTLDDPSDNIMGSGPSGPKKKSPAQTEVPVHAVNSVPVAELDTDLLNRRPSMPDKNEQINTNNSTSNAVSGSSGKGLSGSQNSMNTSDSPSAGINPPQTSKMPKRKQNQVHEEDEPCQSPSLCTCRPHSSGGRMSRTRPPSYEIYTYLESIFRVEGREVDYVQGDGNCFFRALSKQIYNSEECHFELRQTIMELMERHRSEFEQFTDTQDFSTYIQEMKKFAMWATTAEIYGAATLLQQDIYVFSPDHTGTQYRWLLFSPRFPSDREMDAHCQQCYITLCHTNGNHYDRVISLDASCNCTLTPPQLAGRLFTIDLACDTNTNNGTKEPMGQEEVPSDQTLLSEE